MSTAPPAPRLRLLPARPCWRSRTSGVMTISAQADGWLPASTVAPRARCSLTVMAWPRSLARPTHAGRADAGHRLRGRHLLLAFQIRVDASASLAAEQAAHVAQLRDQRQTVARFLEELAVDRLYHRRRPPGQVHLLERRHAGDGLLAHDVVTLASSGCTHAGRRRCRQGHSGSESPA